MPDALCKKEWNGPQVWYGLFRYLIREAVQEKFSGKEKCPTSLNPPLVPWANWEACIEELVTSSVRVLEC